MFDPTLMAGQRILVTGGGTGLGQAMAEQFLRLGADVAICGRTQGGLRRHRRGLAGAVSRAPHRHLRRRHPHRRRGRGDGRVALAVGRPHRPGQQRRRQLRRPHREPLVARLRRRRQHRLPRHLLRDAGGRQALGRRGEDGRVDERPALPQRDEHHRHLGRQRLALRRALGDEQGRHRGDDEVAGDRVGALRHPPQRGRPRRDPDRGHEQAPQPRRGARRALARDETRWRGKAR